jgi:hypothetical protein
LGSSALGLVPRYGEDNQEIYSGLLGLDEKELARRRDIGE